MGCVQGYETEVQSETDSLKYFFVSRGKANIIKVIEYQYTQEFEGRSLYNLAFGDYDSSNKTLLDGTNCNNGDVYLVFRTVLSTIPNFFIEYPGAMLMVQGSDSASDLKRNAGQNANENVLKDAKNLTRESLFISTMLIKTSRPLEKTIDSMELRLLKKKTSWSNTRLGNNMTLFFYEEDKYICIMEAKGKKEDSSLLASEKELLSLIAEKLKDKVLFPKKLEAARNYVKNITLPKEG